MPLSQDILDDSGYKSRKYVALYVYFALALGGLALTYLSKTVADSYGTFCMALSAGLGLYYGVNFGHTWAATKAPSESSPAAPEAPPSSPEEPN